MKDLLNSIGNALSVALGLFQLAAITLGLSAYTGWHWAITIFIAILLAPVPILGTLAAIVGAMYAWHWPLMQSAIYFLVPLAIVIVLTSTAGGISTVNKMRNR